MGGGLWARLRLWPGQQTRLAKLRPGTRVFFLTAEPLQLITRLTPHSRTCGCASPRLPTTYVH